METTDSVSSVGSTPALYSAWGTCSFERMVEISVRGLKLLLTMAAFWFLFMVLVLGVYDPSLHALAAVSSVFFVMTGSSAGFVESLV